MFLDFSCLGRVFGCYQSVQKRSFEPNFTRKPRRREKKQKKFQKSVWRKKAKRGLNVPNSTEGNEENKEVGKKVLTANGREWTRIKQAIHHARRDTESGQRTEVRSQSHKPEKPPPPISVSLRVSVVKKNSFFHIILLRSLRFLLLKSIPKRERKKDALPASWHSSFRGNHAAGEPI